MAKVVLKRKPIKKRVKRVIEASTDMRMKKLVSDVDALDTVQEQVKTIEFEIKKKYGKKLAVLRKEGKALEKELLAECEALKLLKVEGTVKDLEVRSRTTNAIKASELHDMVMSVDGQDARFFDLVSVGIGKVKDVFGKDNPQVTAIIKSDTDTFNKVVLVERK